MPAGPATNDADNPRRRWNSRYRSKWGINGNRGGDREPEPDLLVAAEPPALVRLLAGAGLHTAGPPGPGRAGPGRGPAGPDPGGNRWFAVDLAGGDGDGAVALARRGFATVLVDVSDVALEVAARRAEAAGVSIETVLLDLEDLTLGQVLDVIKRAVPDLTTPAEPPAGSEPRLLITCTHYLNRPLLRSVPNQLPPGATFAAAIATERNLQRNRRPSARFLLDDGELVSLLAGSEAGYVVLHEREHWTSEGTNEAEVVVSRARS